MRENFVMRDHERLHRLSLVLGHGGYLLGLCEYGVTEVVLLRLFAMGGCGAVVGYQLLQPRVQWVTAVWCFIYVGVNVYQLNELRLPPEPELSWEEAKLQEVHGKDISTTHFHTLMALGEWQWLVDGAVLMAEGDDIAEARLTFLTEGTCDVTKGDQLVGKIGPGSTLGEMCLVTAEAQTTATVKAVGSVRCFTIPMPVVQARMAEMPELKAPLERLFSKTIAKKAITMSDRAKVLNYRAVLEVACTLDMVDGISDGVEKFRQKNGLSIEVHEQLMQELPQCVHMPFHARAPRLEEEFAPEAVPAEAVAAPAEQETPSLAMEVPSLTIEAPVAESLAVSE